MVRGLLTNKSNTDDTKSVKIETVNDVMKTNPHKYKEFS